jgi:hypothetical protein
MTALPALSPEKRGGAAVRGEIYCYVVSMTDIYFGGVHCAGLVLPGPVSLWLSRASSKQEPFAKSLNNVLQGTMTTC